MKNLRVASVQFNHRANDKVYNLSVVEHYVKQAAIQKVEIIVFPENVRDWLLACIETDKEAVFSCGVCPRRRYMPSTIGDVVANINSLSALAYWKKINLETFITHI